jgi:hypothetical protein
MKKIGRNLIVVSKFCRDEIFECFMGFENSQKTLTQIGIMVFVEKELSRLRM